MIQNLWKQVSEIFKRGYLLAYNLSQFAGWCYIGLLIWPHLLKLVKNGWHSSSADAYVDCSAVLRVFLLVPYLEVVHNVTGLVKGNAVLTFCQVTGRAVYAFIITDNFANAREHPAYVTLLAVWSLSEIIRYLFYALNIMDLKVRVVTWLRYSLFIVLYPVGVASELTLLFTALPAVKTSTYLSLTLPNRFNATFSLYYALIIFALLYIPMFPQLYFHVFAQRRKVLGGAQKQKDQ